MVSLLDYAGPNHFLRIFASLFVISALIGVGELVSALTGREIVNRVLRMCSLLVSSAAVLGFIMTRDPYASGLLFMMLLFKLFLMIYRTSKISR